MLRHPQPANEVSPQTPNEKGSFVPIHLLGSHHCLHPHYPTLLRFSKCVLSLRPSPNSLQDIVAKTFQEHQPQGPLPSPACFTVGRAFLKCGEQFTVPLTESCTPIHLPSLSARAFLLQRASPFRSVLEGAAPPALTIWEALLELGTSLSKHNPAGAFASTHAH